MIGPAKRTYWKETKHIKDIKDSSQNQVNSGASWAYSGTFTLVIFIFFLFPCSVHGQKQVCDSDLMASKIKLGNSTVPISYSRKSSREGTVTESVWIHCPYLNQFGEVVMWSFDNFIVALPNKLLKKIKTRICYWGRKKLWPDKNNSHHNHVCQHIPHKTTRS